MALILATYINVSHLWLGLALVVITASPAICNCGINLPLLNSYLSCKHGILS